MELITKLSGLLKAITHTIRVMVSSVYFFSDKNFILRISANPDRWAGLLSSKETCESNQSR
jgi:hypothetical protein